MSQIRDTSQPGSLIAEKNAAPFDPNAGWKEDDVVPDYYVTSTGTKGSAADNSDAHGTWKDGVWTVLWTRKLDTGHPEDDKIMTDEVKKDRLWLPELIVPARPKDSLMRISFVKKIYDFRPE